MKPSVFKVVVAGLGGGAAFWVVTFVMFVLVGSGPLFDPALQSPKFIRVWTELEPLPLFASAPHLVLLAYALFGVGYALLLRSVARAWPAGAWARIWRLAAVIWGLSCAFFELLGPANLLGEPPVLVALELGFWAVAALAEAAVVVALQRQRVHEAPAAAGKRGRIVVAEDAQ